MTAGYLGPCQRWTVEVRQRERADRKALRRHFTVDFLKVGSPRRRSKSGAVLEHGPSVLIAIRAVGQNRELGGPHCDGIQLPAAGANEDRAAVGRDRRRGPYDATARVEGPLLLTALRI